MPDQNDRTDPALDLLLEAARRTGRGGAARSVLLLRLPSLPDARPHHARIARAILLDIAQRLEGEVLRLQSGALALLCRHRPGVPDPFGPDGVGEDGLPAVLTRLFGTVTGEDAPLFTVWNLPRDAEQMRCTLRHPLTAVPQPITRPAEANPLDAVGTLLDFTTLPELMRRQTAVSLHAHQVGRSLAPAFRELTFSIDALEARGAAIGQAQADPFVFRHLTAQLDARMLLALSHQFETGSGLDALNDGLAGAVPLHINLAVPGVLSAPFDRLAAVCRTRGIGLGAELSLVEACADPSGFAAARARLRAAGVALVLDAVSPGAMQMIRPAGLGADLIKLDWTPDLPRLAGMARGRLQESLRAAGFDRLVLHRAETEAALHWGLAQGITRFQGRHIDAMLGAARITTCAHADGCSLRQCIDRGAAIHAAGRAGCLAPALLEGGTRLDSATATA